MDRRTFLVAGGALALATSARAADPVVETAQGRVRGRDAGGIQAFKGLRYGASTAGSNRFMPPRPPPNWAGVQDAFEYADHAPQTRGNLLPPGPMSEDCLRINIWTPAADGRRRPVMVWFHGGGFESGSGSSSLYDGTRLARRGDVVVATVNHRLNVFGHCFLGGRGDFARSGNVGYLDLLAALRWVRENISAFGGDPGNVTIFGQSGGGRKVSLCYAGREAQGLFHRGIVQSGSHLVIQTPEQAARLTDHLLRELSLPAGDARPLQAVPVATLSEASRKVIQAEDYRFSPVRDGLAFQANPFLPEAPQVSRRLPMMVGANRTELSNQLGREPGIFGIDEAALNTRLRTFLPPADIPEAIRIFRASRPQASPSELFFTITSARGYVRDRTILAEQRARLGAAPTYVYQLMWRSPVEGGRRVTQHSLDLPFVFDNVESPRGLEMAGPPTEDTRRLTDFMAGAWLAFARTGDPNHPGLPTWRPYDLTRRSTMLFDVPSRAADDPLSEERRFMARYDTQQLGRTLHRQDL